MCVCVCACLCVCVCLPACVRVCICRFPVPSPLQVPSPGERPGLRCRLGADPRDAPRGRLGGQDVSEAVCGNTRTSSTSSSPSSRLLTLQHPVSPSGTGRRLSQLVSVGRAQNAQGLCMLLPKCVTFDRKPPSVMLLPLGTFCSFAMQFGESPSSSSAIGSTSGGMMEGRGGRGLEAGTRSWQDPGFFNSASASPDIGQFCGTIRGRSRIRASDFIHFFRISEHF